MLPKCDRKHSSSDCWHKRCLEGLIIIRRDPINEYSLLQQFYWSLGIHKQVTSAYWTDIRSSLSSHVALTESKWFWSFQLHLLFCKGLSSRLPRFDQVKTQVQNRFIQKTQSLPALGLQVSEVSYLVLADSRDSTCSCLRLQWIFHDSPLQ